MNAVAYESVLGQASGHVGVGLSETRHVVAIIPARGGSKGLPRKNTKVLFGKPLIAYTIESALRCALITDIVVSSDDGEILEIAKSYTKCRVLKRPAELATDSADLRFVVEHVCTAMYEELSPLEFVITMYPTHPFRPAWLMEHLVRKGLEGHGSVGTVKKICCQPDQYFSVEHGCLHRLFQATSTTAAYRPYGLFSGFRTDHSVFPYNYIIKDKIQLIDIDTIEDFILAEEVLRNGLFSFEGDGCSP